MRHLKFALRWSHHRFRYFQIITALALLLTLVFIFFNFFQQDIETNGELNWKLSLKKRYQQPSCTEKHNIVNIKMIKCASTTMAYILRRFGHTRNLTFVLPLKNRIYIGWPYQIDHTMYRPYRKTPNILCEHSIYNRNTISQIMPLDTVYITSLREPFSQVKSMLNYYNVFNISGVKSDNPLQEYLENIIKYEAIYKSTEASMTRYCIPDGFSMTRNLMSYILGFPTGFLPGTTDMSQDTNYIKEWIKSLDAEFHLVMITEYFYESIILLRRMMCWTFQDILFSTTNQLKYGHKNQIDDKLVKIYKQWSRVDYMLYDHFNATLWKRLNQEKEEFWDEVRHFQRVNEAVNEFCESSDKTVTLTVSESVWNSKIIISAEFCSELYEDILPKLQTMHDNQLPKLDDPIPSKYTC